MYCIPIYGIVDCKWNDWIIGGCTKSCGGGIRTNTRTKNATSAHGGKECDGVSFAEERCNEQNCPGNKTIDFIAIFPRLKPISHIDIYIYMFST